VPTYPAGLPLVMGAFQRVAGPGAVFYVVPLLGALAVWMTARLGAIVDRPLTGALAAMLLASSPTFVRQVIQPVSDVPAAAWWTLCLALAGRTTAVAALVAGAAAAFAILTRPNLVALVAIVASFYAVRALRPPANDSRPAALKRL